MKKWPSIILLIFTQVFVFNAFGKERATDPLKYLQIQDAGRVKPYDTFARETLQLVWGKQSYKPEGKEVSKPATEVIMTWIMAPQLWDDQKFIRLDHRGMKEALKIDLKRKYYSPRELVRNPRMDLVLRELAEMRRNNEKLTPYFQSVQRLENQLMTFHNLRLAGLRVAPAPKGHPNGDAWLAIAQLDGELKQRFIDLSKAFAKALQSTTAPQKEADSSYGNKGNYGDSEAAETAAKEGSNGDGEMAPEEENEIQKLAKAEKPDISDANYEAKDMSLEEAVKAFSAAAQKNNPDLYADVKMIDTEVFYNNLHPFLWSWILYLFGALFALVFWQTNWKYMYFGAWFVTVAGLLLHSYGFYLRVILTGRPPVSNMYETVIWVAWGAIAFALGFEWLKKRGFILLSGCLTGVLCMIVADNAPIILDKSLQPLEPVLRSNMWLTVHVLTITLSYAPLFLASALGIAGLVYIIKGEGESSEKVKALAQACYRCIQIGVVLLAAGTILGGVWADYSWGRFWGWDPKETWALIALLGYLAILHGRLVGWVRNFAMLAWSVVTFNLVIMAWYGVNFVLGAGLHSYGFGAGGIEYVASFCGILLVFVIYAAHVHYILGRKGKAGSEAAEST